MRPTLASLPPRRISRGATLIEVAILIVIAAVLAVLAVPSYREWIADSRLRSHADTLAATLNRARTDAMRTGSRVTVCKSVDLRVCAEAGGWEQGWLLFVDNDRSASIDSVETTLQTEPAAKHAITIVGNRPIADYVSYTSWGHARKLDGALQMGTFVACSPGRFALRVVLAHSGRVRIERTKDRCS